MKCVSCETEINPKWRHAIDINVCPFCGQHIMEEHLKNCVADLAKAMEAMQKYPEQLNDWMLSNHNYIKTDSPDLKNYLPKELIKELRKEIDEQEFQEKKSSMVTIKLPGGGTEEVLVEKTQSSAKTNGFFDRAEVLKGAGKTSGKAAKAQGEPEAPKSVAEKTQHLRNVVQKIKSEGVQREGFTEAEIDMASELGVSPETLENADPVSAAEIQALVSGSTMIASGLPPVSDSLDEESAMADRVLANNLRMASKKDMSSAQERDMQTLREMQNKVSNTQKKLGTGGFGRA